MTEGQSFIRTSETYMLVLLDQDADDYTCH